MSNIKLKLELQRIELITMLKQFKNEKEDEIDIQFESRGIKPVTWTIYIYIKVLKIYIIQSYEFINKGYIKYLHNEFSYMF